MFIPRKQSNGPKSPQIRMIRELVYNSFCPIVSCATLSALRHRKTEVSTWLSRELGSHLGRPSFVDCEALERWNIVLVGKIRLLECQFATMFSWKGNSRDVTWTVARPYDYDPAALADYYASSSVFHSRRIGCGNCKQGQLHDCLKEMHMCLEMFLPWSDTRHFSHPDFGSTSPSQLKAWSFTVSLISLAVVGFFVNSYPTVSWCRLVLSLSRPCVETALRADGLWMPRELKRSVSNQLT